MFLKKKKLLCGILISKFIDRKIILFGLIDLINWVIIKFERIEEGKYVFRIFFYVCYNFFMWLKFFSIKKNFDDMYRWIIDYEVELKYLL